jgi:hypothetical protein
MAVVMVTTSSLGILEYTLLAAGALDVLEEASVWDGLTTDGLITVGMMD